MPVTQSKNAPVPRFEVKLNGSPLSAVNRTALVRVVVEDGVGLPGMFVLEATQLTDQNPEIPWIDDLQFSAIGTSVEVQLGYAGKLATLLKGEITGLEPEFATNRLPSLIIRGYDRRHRLQRGHKTRTFVQQKDSDIAAQIASAAGLTAETEDSQVVHDYVLQANQTDMQFLQDRANRIHYEVVVDDKTLFFRPVANTESEILTLTFEDDLLEFYPRLTSMGQMSEVTVRGWNPKDKESIVGQAKGGDEGSTMGGQTSGAGLIQTAFAAAIGQMGDRPVMTQAEADQLATAKFNQGILELIRGEGRCRGRTDLRAGTVIKIAGIGKRFSGQYYVTTASHRYSASGYYTHFTVQRNAV